jgi:hypothetical protein
MALGEGGKAVAVGGVLFLMAAMLLLFLFLHLFASRREDDSLWGWAISQETLGVVTWVAFGTLSLVILLLSIRVLLP